MSWSGYCDDLVNSGYVDKAAICGLDDGSVWGQTAGFNINPTEVKAVAAGFRNPDPIWANGITLGGTKYLCIAADNAFIMGKQGINVGVSIAKSGKCIIIGTFKDVQHGGNCVHKVEALRDYLSTNGY